MSDESNLLPAPQPEARPAPQPEATEQPDQVTLHQYVIEKGIPTADARHMMAVHAKAEITMESKALPEEFEALFDATSKARV